ncbi:MAG: hypothetical protein JO127_08265 [Caulobacteraceae bacterium]|nr:hypothetical protein [Caulobacteraceae bacterium]
MTAFAEASVARTERAFSPWWFLAALALVAFVAVGRGENMALTGAALVVLLGGMKLLARPGEAPILLYVFIFQWVEAALSIFMANLQKAPIEAIARTPSNMGLATFLSLAGLVALALGMRAAAGPVRRVDALWARAQAATIPRNFFLYVYLVAFVISTGAQKLADMVPPLSQPLLVFTSLKWAAFVVFTYATFSARKSSRAVWLCVFAVSFVLSLGGYFSSFKFIFIYAVIGLAAAGVRMSFVRALGLSLLSVLVLVFGSVWSEIKPDYRAYVSGGQASQVLTVGYGDQLRELGRLTQSLDAASLADGFQKLVMRVAYVEYFGDVLNYVPAVVHFQHGRLWADAIGRPFMPRMFFPGKAIIDESAETNEYTGLGVAGLEQGTQISIGYMGESYIDFGPLGMMAALFGLGAVLGATYRWLMRSRYTRGVLGLGFAASILVSVADIGMSAAKLAGALSVAVLVIWLLTRFVVPRLVPRLRADGALVARALAAQGRHGLAHAIGGLPAQPGRS